MENALTQKLTAFLPLSDSDKRALDGLIHKSYAVAPGRDLIEENDTPSNIHLILDGFACRYKLLPNGTRQIVAFLVAGDFCDLHVALLDAMDHSVGTLSRCTVVEIPRSAILSLAIGNPRITTGFWMAALVDQATLREWIVNLGRRSAVKRIAHLLCEIMVRLEVTGRVIEDAFDLPLTQTELGDALGLSTVHVNRSLQTLLKWKLVSLKRGRLTVHDVPRLKELSEFNPNYLHLAEKMSKGPVLAAGYMSGL